jgi:DNA-binding FadR family transcriptional regulator
VESTVTSGRPRRNLTQTVIADLRARILGETLKPGDKLPTEQQLVEEFGVSRTVIREAIASLRADGLIEARHGVGVFVLEPPKKTVKLSFLDEDTQRISSVIETLELRAAVEIEAAGLAASRCSPAQAARIRERFDDMSASITRGETAEDADFAFHIAIADATNNRQFTEFLEFLGRRTIPRSQLKGLKADEYATIRNEERLQEEHRAIMQAVCSHDVEQAREAMRTHLKGSLERYRRLTTLGGEGAA